jgi:RNA polymerase sigma factor (sigma-70 family)
MPVAATILPSLGLSEALVSLAERQDSSAWLRLIELAGDSVTHVCTRLSGDSAFAADAVQETFLHLRDKCGSFRMPVAGNPDRAAFGWIMRVAINVTLLLQRRRRRMARREHRYVRGHVHGIVSEPSEPVEREEVATLVRQALSGLSSANGTAVSLRYIAGLDMAQVAVELNIAPAAAHKRLQRGLDALRKRLRSAGVVVSIVALIALLDELPAASIEGLDLPALLRSAPATKGVTLFGTGSVAIAASLALAGIAVATLSCYVEFFSAGRDTATTQPTVIQAAENRPAGDDVPADARDELNFTVVESETYASPWCITYEQLAAKSASWSVRSERTMAGRKAMISRSYVNDQLVYVGVSDREQRWAYWPLLDILCREQRGEGDVIDAVRNMVDAARLMAEKTKAGVDMTHRPCVIDGTDCVEYRSRSDRNTMIWAIDERSGLVRFVTYEPSAGLRAMVAMMNALSDVPVNSNTTFTQRVVDVGRIALFPQQDELTTAATLVIDGSYEYLVSSLRGLELRTPRALVVDPVWPSGLYVFAPRIDHDRVAMAKVLQRWSERNSGNLYDHDGIFALTSTGSAMQRMLADRRENLDGVPASLRRSMDTYAADAPTMAWFEEFKRHGKDGHLSQDALAREGDVFSQPETVFEATVRLEGQLGVKIIVDPGINPAKKLFGAYQSPLRISGPVPAYRVLEWIAAVAGGQLRVDGEVVHISALEPRASN